MRGPYSTPITPLTGSLFHADPHLSLHELLEEPVLEAQPGAARLAAAWSLIERPQDRKAVLAFVQALAEKDR